MSINNSSNIFSAQPQCQNQEDGLMPSDQGNFFQMIIAFLFSSQNIIAIIIFVLGYLFGRRKRTKPQQESQQEVQPNINIDKQFYSDTSQKGCNHVNKVKQVDVDIYESQDMNFTDHNSFSGRGVIESRKYSNHSAGGNWNEELSSANSDLSFQNNDHAFQNGHKNSYLEDHFDQNNQSSSDAKDLQPKKQEEQTEAISKQSNVASVLSQQQQSLSNNSNGAQTNNAYNGELAVMIYNPSPLDLFQQQLNNNIQNNNNQNQLMIANSNYNGTNKFTSDEGQGRQQRKLLTEIGNGLVKRKSKTSNMYGLSEESEEEIFFEQCTFKNAPLRKQADFKIEFEQDDTKGVFRKIETHQVITDYIQSKETHKEIEEIKSTFQEKFKIENGQALDGFKISHIKQNLQMIPLIEKIKSQNLSGSIPSEDKLQSLQNIQFNSFEKDQQLALYNKPFKVDTTISPLFNTGHIKQYLDNGKFIKFYRVMEELGRGGFGRVYRVQSMVEEKMYAIKKIAVPYDGISNPKEHKYFREVKSIMSLNHVNIVRYHTSWWESCDDEMVNQVNEYLQTNNNLFSADNSPSVSASYNNRKSKYDQKSSVYSKQSGNVTQSFALSYNNDVSCIEWEQSEEENQNPNLSSDDSASKKGDHAKTIKQYNEQNKSNKTFNISKEPQLLTLYIQLEYCSGKTLRNYLDEQTHGLDNKDTFLIFSQMLEGVSYLHQNGIIHRDLKPSNILFENKVVKIGDFGLSIKQELGLTTPKQNDFTSHHNFDGGDNIDSPVYTGNVGTPFYMPPEQSDKSGKYNEKIDVYSLGIILLEMIHKMETYHEKLEIVKKLKSSSELPKNLLKTQKYACELITSMTSLRPQNRPSIESILQGKTYGSWKKKALNLDR